MIRIHAHHRKPLDTSFHKECRSQVRKDFYYYMPKPEAKGYVNNAHTISVRLNQVNDEMRGLFCKYLTSIGVEISDKSLYLLSLLQKVGEDKITASLGYNNSLCSSLQEMTLEQLGDSHSTIYNSGASENMFKESLGLSIFVAQALIFAFNTFKSIWGRVKNA